jgi:hypothetical protein
MKKRYSRIFSPFWCAWWLRYDSASFPSGLVPGWGQKAAMDLSDKQVLGGLEDDDAFSIQPTSDALSVKNRANSVSYEYIPLYALH